MVLDPIPQPLHVHFFGSRPQPPTSRVEVLFNNIVCIRVYPCVSASFHINRSLFIYVGLFSQNVRIHTCYKKEMIFSNSLWMIFNNSVCMIFSVWMILYMWKEIYVNKKRPVYVKRGAQYHPHTMCIQKKWISSHGSDVQQSCVAL